MIQKIKRILEEHQGTAFPLVIAVVLALLLLFCCVSEYFRLQIITAGVREALQDGVITVVNDNYAGVYHGIREGYAGGYQASGGTGWEPDVIEGDIYTYLDSTLGMEMEGERHVKYAGEAGTAVEFALDGLQVTLCNAPLAPADPGNSQRFEADAVIRLEVPVRFGGRLLPSIHLTLKVQAGYIEVF